MTRLGGQHIYLGRDEVGLGNRETPEDVSRCVSRWVDAIAVRTFAHETIECLAEAASVPVINALTDREHPCQALADFYTILEHRSETAGMKFVFVGDGNNVANSLMLLAPRLGTHFVLACPPGYEPLPEVEAQARALAEECGTKFEITNDALAAADDADILYTDVWTSMGQEEESAKRLRDFSSYQINAEMIREAKEDVLVMHGRRARRAVLGGLRPGGEPAAHSTGTSRRGPVTKRRAACLRIDDRGRNRPCIQEKRYVVEAEN
jgi:ornithine carbamoyltransferase